MLQSCDVVLLLHLRREKHVFCESHHYFENTMCEKDGEDGGHFELTSLHVLNDEENDRDRRTVQSRNGAVGSAGQREENGSFLLKRKINILCSFCQFMNNN